MQGTRVLFPAQGIKILHAVQWASLVTQTVKNLPEMQETQVQSQGQEDLLEKGMATDSSILAWKIHGQRSLAQVVGIKSFLGF